MDYMRSLLIGLFLVVALVAMLGIVEKLGG